MKRIALFILLIITISCDKNDNECNIIGKVLDDSNWPIANAIITLSVERTGSSTTYDDISSVTTTYNGNFQLSNIPMYKYPQNHNGGRLYHYRISCTHPDYESFVSSIIPTFGQTTTYNIILKKKK